MTDFAHKTKADLAAELAEAQTRTEHAKAQLDEQKSMWTSMDEEARAIDRCVGALDALQASRRTRSTTINAQVWAGDSYGYAPRAPGDVERVLDYLRTRYGVPDPNQERDALRSEVNRLNRELAQAREQVARITEAVRG